MGLIIVKCCYSCKNISLLQSAA